MGKLSTNFKLVSHRTSLSSEVFMKIITKKIQREIEKNRDIIYDYIRSHPIDNPKEMSDVVEALCNISCDCGIWSSPSSSIVK